jgi:hypothetical protein
LADYYGFAGVSGGMHREVSGTWLRGIDAARSQQLEGDRD